MKIAVIEKKGEGYEARLEQGDGKFVIQHARKGPLVEYCRLREYETIIVEPVFASEAAYRWFCHKVAVGAS